MAMKLKWYAPRDLKPELKFKIHKTGKIGITKGIERWFKLKPNQTMMLGFNESDKNDKHLYGILHDEIRQDGFIFRKAGVYLYLNANVLFDNLNIPYQNGKWCLLAEELVFEGNTIFKFTIKEKNN